MRRSVILVLVVLSLLLPLGSAGLLDSASARPGPADHRAGTGLLITFHGWGKLQRGMTARQAQHTGMVSKHLDHCAPGYQMTKPYLKRGWVVWDWTSKPWTVKQIVIVGSRDHTYGGTHPGTTLGQLRRQHAHLSKVVRGGSLTGQVPSKQDIWVAWVKTRRGTIVYEFPYGSRPTRTTRLDTIVVSKKPVAYYGC